MDIDIIEEKEVDCLVEVIVHHLTLAQEDAIVQEAIIGEGVILHPHHGGLSAK